MKKSNYYDAKKYLNLSTELNQDYLLNYPSLIQFIKDPTNEELMLAFTLKPSVAKKLTRIHPATQAWLMHRPINLKYAFHLLDINFMLNYMRLLNKRRLKTFLTSVKYYGPDVIVDAINNYTDYQWS